MPANDLQQLAQLLQIAHEAQQPQLQQQQLAQEGQHQKLAMALQALGLMQQGQEGQGRLDLERQGLTQTGEHNSAMEGLEGRRVEGEQAHQKALEALQGQGQQLEGQHYADEAARSKAMEDQSHQQGGLAGLSELARMRATGQAPDAQWMGAFKQLYPDLVPGMEAGQREADDTAFNTNKDSVSKMFAKGTPPPGALEALFALGHVPPGAQGRLRALGTIPQARSFTQDPGTTATSPSPWSNVPTGPATIQHQNYDAQGNPTNMIQQSSSPLMDLLRHIAPAINPLGQYNK